MSVIKRVAGIGGLLVAMLVAAAGVASADTEPGASYSDTTVATGSTGAVVQHKKASAHGGDARYRESTVSAGVGGASVRRHSADTDSGYHRDGVRRHRGHDSAVRDNGTAFRDTTTTAGPHGASSSGVEAATTRNGSGYHKWANAAGPSGAVSSGVLSVSDVTGSAFRQWLSTAGPEGATHHDTGAIAASGSVR
ncbi:hypothetical protein [Amycolatopsis minnesotensis]|uniref:Uncharacterized protein n=1 Tax=Amycolatopsis minnesotensis TaxID=337894 RepID=A0ABP5BMX6_9PSEU